MMKPFLSLVIGVTVAGLAATSVVAAADHDSFAMRSATVDGERQSITLVYSDGRRRIEHPETAGDTFGVPGLSADGGAVGWTVERIDGASYPYPEWLQFIHRGVRRRLMCRSGMPWAWRFEGNDRVVVDCSSPHGEVDHHRVLWNIGTGRILGNVSMPEDPAADRTLAPWARQAMPGR